VTVPYIALFRLHGHADSRAAGRSGLRAELADGIFRQVGGPSEAVILTGIDEPREMNLHREGNDFSPPFDLAIKADYADDDSFMANLADFGGQGRFAAFGAFRTEAVLKKGAPHPWAPGVIPGIHMLHPLHFHEDLPRSALLRSWREVHGDLAPQAHAGATYYAQQLTLRRWGPPALDYGGFSEFHFPSMTALVEGYFASDEARKAVRHDIRHFIRGLPPRMFATAYRYVG
jgi:hypothetical protein